MFRTYGAIFFISLWFLKLILCRCRWFFLRVFLQKLMKCLTFVVCQCVVVPPFTTQTVVAWPNKTEFDALHISNAKNMSRNIVGKSVVGLAIRRIIRIAFVFEHTHYFKFYYCLTICSIFSWFLLPVFLRQNYYSVA